MEYRKIGDTLYLRMDKGDEIIENLLGVCKKEGISSATFYGIGGCSEAQIQTFLPEQKAFETHTLCGMLELVSLCGNITLNEQGEIAHHTHAMFAYKDGERHCTMGGHIQAVTVLYTAEIELRPVTGGVIHRRFDPETGTGFWSF